MKSIALILLVLTLSCSKKKEPTQQELIQGIVTSYILENSGNPDSYEPVSFYEYDSIIIDEAYFRNNARYREYKDAFLIDSNEENANKLEGVTARIQVEGPRYSIKHKYRMDNAFGGKQLYNIEFKLNRDLKIILPD